jgi:hypothetical protein
VIVAVEDDGRDGHFGILVEDESALDAHEPIGLGWFQRAKFQIGATQRAEAVRALIVWMHSGSWL